MKKLISAIALFCCLYNCTAQSDSTKKQVDTTTYTKVDIEAAFPGGREGWRTFLQKNILYPSRAIQNKIQGTVVLQFVVCNDGTVCDIQALSGPQELQEAAITLLKKTPKWNAAVVMGKDVRSYHKQSIIYRLGP